MPRTLPGRLRTPNPGSTRPGARCRPLGARRRPQPRWPRRRWPARVPRRGRRARGRSRRDARRGPRPIADDARLGAGAADIEAQPPAVRASTSRPGVRGRRRPSQAVAQAQRSRHRVGRFRPATAMAAAVPAAWPMAMHCAIERTEAWASCVAREAAPGHEHVGRSPAPATCGRGCPRPRPSGRYCHFVSAPAMVVLDGRAAEADLVVELPGTQDVLARQPVVAVDAAGLAHADLRRERHQRGALVAGHLVDAGSGRIRRPVRRPAISASAQQPRIGGVDQLRSPSPSERIAGASSPSRSCPRRA